MAHILLLTTKPHVTGSYEKLLARVELDRFRDHGVTDDPLRADLILFVESWGVGPFLEEMRAHPFVRAFRDKCFCFCEKPETIPFLPGIYTAIEQRWYNTGRTRSGFYLAMYQNPHVVYKSADQENPRFLYSFTGASDTSPIRDELFKLKHLRSFLLDTTTQALHVRNHGTPAETTQFEKQYASTIEQSQFVLCPRGVSPSSVRLFDTMNMGRVPVIISDAWVPPSGPDWNAFSIRVPEHHIAAIPSILEENEIVAPEMGKKARLAYEEWFAPDVAFHRIVEWCLEIMRTRRRSETVLRYLAFRQLLTRPYIGRYLRTRIRLFRERGRLVL